MRFASAYMRWRSGLGNVDCSLVDVAKPAVSSPALGHPVSSQHVRTASVTEAYMHSLFAVRTAKKNRVMVQVPCYDVLYLLPPLLGLEVTMFRDGDLPAVSDDVCVVVFSDPNNPTGRPLDPSVVRDLARGVNLIIDTVFDPWRWFDAPSQTLVISSLKKVCGQDVSWVATNDAVLYDALLQNQFNVFRTARAPRTPGAIVQGPEPSDDGDIEEARSVVSSWTHWDVVHCHEGVPFLTVDVRPEILEAFESIGVALAPVRLFSGLREADGTHRVSLVRPAKIRELLALAGAVVEARSRRLT